MRNLIVATFVIIALGSTIKCEAKALFFPFRFDYKQDKTNDGAVKTLVYSSPFTGRTYNFEHLSRWNFNQDTSATTSKPPSPRHHGHAFNWDLNWNFNHGSKTVNKEDTKPTEETTTVAPSSTSKSYNGQIGHKKIDVNWSFDYNHGSATTLAAKTSSVEGKTIADDESVDDAKKVDEKVDETVAEDMADDSFDDNGFEDDIDPTVSNDE